MDIENEPKKSLIGRFDRIKWLLLIFLVIAVAVIIILSRGSKQGQKSTISEPQQTPQIKTKKEAKIKSIGFNLDYYNPATNTAGDIKFAKFKAPYDRILTDFGYKMAAENNANRQEALNVHPTFLLPMGTKVLATIDGTIVDVPKLYSNDYSVQISADGGRNGLIFELEHVKNPLVKTGDKVKAGQPVAEVTDFSSEHHPGYGYFDLAVFQSTGSQPQHLCPFLYLDDSIKAEVFAKIRALYASWEEYMGNDKMYDEDAYTIPGCITLDPIDG